MDPLPPELASLGAGYDRIVAEVTAGRMSPADALAALAANQTVDGGGNVWAYDQTGRLTVTRPGAGPVTATGAEWMPPTPFQPTPPPGNPFTGTPEPANPFTADAAFPAPAPPPGPLPAAEVEVELVSPPHVGDMPMPTPVTGVDALLTPPPAESDLPTPPWMRTPRGTQTSSSNPNFPHPAGGDLLTPPADADAESGRPRVKRAALTAFVKRNLGMVIVSVVGILLLLAALVVSSQQPSPASAPADAATPTVIAGWAAPTMWGGLPSGIGGER